MGEYSNYNDKIKAYFEDNVTEKIKLPKPLADTIEAIIGAIYIDCEESISIVTDKILPLLQPRISKYIRCKIGI